MSRHRNVRSMDITDGKVMFLQLRCLNSPQIIAEYDEYEDVYGHSVEDDYCVSPSTAAFMYDREGANQKISAYIKKVKDIAEEDESDGDLQVFDVPCGSGSFNCVNCGFFRFLLYHLQRKKNLKKMLLKLCQF